MFRMQNKNDTVKEKRVIRTFALTIKIIHEHML